MAFGTDLKAEKEADATSRRRRERSKVAVAMAEMKPNRIEPQRWEVLHGRGREGREGFYGRV